MIRKIIKLTIVVSLIVLAGCSPGKLREAEVSSGLILDLNADKGVTMSTDGFVISWTNQVPDAAATEFNYTDEGREFAGSGRPKPGSSTEELNNHNSIVFQEDELINDNDKAFDGLITGKGYTWFVVIKPYQQHRGEGDYPQAFFGCLRNTATPQLEEGQFAGFWGSFYIDGKVWMGSRNGEGEFSRASIDTPEVLGPFLPIDNWYLLAGRQAAGKPGEIVKLDLFINDHSSPVATGDYSVGNWEPSRMAIGTERNAINHQGHESFDGELARILIYERPLSNSEMKTLFEYLNNVYGLSENPVL